jgi:hypothetical protein
MKQSEIGNGVSPNTYMPSELAVLGSQFWDHSTTRYLQRTWWHSILLLGLQRHSFQKHNPMAKLSSLVRY